MLSSLKSKQVRFIVNLVMFNMFKQRVYCAHDVSSSCSFPENENVENIKKGFDYVTFIVRL